MAALRNDGAAAPGPVTPGSDEAPAGGTAQEGTADNRDSASARQSEHALRVIEGEQYARAYLDRLHTGIASPGELAVIVAFLSGDMLHGACRVIEKALGVRHG